MQDFSCLKCGQIVQAERMPHSCPRCYSPASEAYVTPATRKKSVEHAFDVSGAFEGAPGWEQSLTTMELEVPDEVVGEIESGGRSPQVDEAQLEEATSAPRVASGPSANATQELDEEDLETEVYRKIDRIERQRRTAPPPPPNDAPPSDASPPGDAPERRTPPPKPTRRPAPRTQQQAPASRRRRNSVPPTMEAEPTGKGPRRRETTRRQRIPTAQTERVTDTLRSGRRRRVLAALWVTGLLVIALAAVRLFVYPDESGERVPATGTTVALLMPDLGTGTPTVAPDAGVVAPDAGVPAAPASPDGAALPADSGVAAPTPKPVKPRPVKPKPVKPKPVRPKPIKPKPVKPKPVRPKPVKPKPKPRAPAPKVPARSKLSAAERRTAAQALYRKGIQQLLLGQTRGAIAQFNQALRTQRNFALAYRGLGLAQQKLGRKSRARAAFSRYLSLRPGAADAASIRARIKTLE